MSLRALVPVFLVSLLGPPGLAQQEQQPPERADPADAQESPEDGAEAQARLAPLRARDARLAFTPDAARRARAVLDAAPSDLETRAVAVLALGCGRAGGDLARIESMLADGAQPERRAALYALGELGNEGYPALERALERDTQGLEQALCLAFLLSERAGVARAVERLQGLASGAEPLARRAQLVLAQRAGLEPAELASTLELYLELRWRAARAYGLVDGQRGQKAFAAELFANEEFLDRVVLAAAAELSTTELKAHLVEILRSGERLGALRVALEVMPEELTRALESGQWKPTPAAWHALLEEVDLRHAEKRCLKLLEVAYRSDPELEFRAGLLLVRAGGDIAWSWIADQLERDAPAARVALIEACGEREGKARLGELGELRARGDELGIAAEIDVALARLGHPPTKSALEALVSGPATPERERAVDALARVLHDRSLWPLAEKALRADDLALAQRLELEIGLAGGGSERDLAALRAALPKAEKHAQRLVCARALAQRGGVADLEALAALFPVEADLELNVELALGLLEHRHAATAGLLRAALWSDSWNRSVLAGGLIVRAHGLRALQDELAMAPRSARERDLRRVGFALGEWGGLGAVEELARNRLEGDPALQGAVLGALAARASEELNPAKPRAKAALAFPTAPKAAGGKGGSGAGKGPKKGRKGRG